MTMFLNNMDAEEIVHRMSASQKDSVYRLLWAEHVKEDVLSKLEEMEDSISENFVEEFVEDIVNQYVYEGKYDCNLSYWDNIDSLIENEMQYIPTERSENSNGRYFPNLQRGDIVGAIYETCNYDGIKSWCLREDKISKVSQTREGWKYYTKSKFRPLYAEDVDSNTRTMEDAIGKGYIITREVFGLNDKTRPFAERWVEWANKNKDKAVSILDVDLDEEDMENEK